MSPIFKVRVGPSLNSDFLSFSIFLLTSHVLMPFVANSQITQMNKINQITIDNQGSKML